MIENQNHKPAGREPLIALAISLACPGVGQVYCGRVVRGLLIFLSLLAYIPIVAASAYAGPSLSTAVLLVATLGFVGLYLIAAIDAFRQARIAGRDYQLRQCNSVPLYLAMLVVGIANPVVSTFLLRASVFEAFRVPTRSMSPTIAKGDRVLVNKVFARGQLPARGELIVFRPPVDRKKMFVQRVVGLPGDTVEIKDGSLVVNGKTLPRDPQPKEGTSIPDSELPGELFEEEIGGKRYRVMLDAAKSSADFKVKVPAGRCFVMGDNRDNSRDSRDFGAIPLGDIEGRVQSIFYPAHSWRRFGSLR